MASDMFGSPLPPESEPEAPGLDLPPIPDGPGLFGEAMPEVMPESPPPAPPVAPAAAESAPAAPYRVLARKYRPQTLDALIGQEALVRTLRNAFAQNRVAHAFMLTGVRGVGKTTTARIIARAMNCIGVDGKGGPTADPCGTCPECRAILADRHPDVLELDAASNNGVDNIRELREAVRFRPAQGRFKIYILDEVHMLSTAAFNALLKTLEEPPPAVKFLFATTEIRKVPATILSRCQRFDLRRVPQEQLSAHFARIAEAESASLETDALAMIARAADGSVRDGLSLLDQAIALAGADGRVTAEAVRDMLGLADRSLVFDLLEAVMAGDLPGALGLMDRTHERGADPGVVLGDLLELTHTLTRFRAVPALREDRSLPEAERTRGVALAQKLSIPVLGRAWQMLLKGVSEVAEAPDRRAAAEMVLIRLAHLAETPTPGDLVRRLTEGGALAGAGRPGPSGGGGGARAEAVPMLRAIAGGGAVPLPTVAAAPVAEAAPLAAPKNFRDVVMLASGRRPMLHAHLVHSTHLVHFAEGRIEIRTRPEAPRDMAGQLAALLLELTEKRWTISLSNEPGEPTLAEQGRTAEAERLSLVRSHPLVLAVMTAFPGTTIEQVHDETLDAYGLPPVRELDEMSEEEIDARDFAPPDAEPAAMDDL